MQTSDERLAAAFARYDEAFRARPINGGCPPALIQARLDVLLALAETPEGLPALLKDQLRLDSQALQRMPALPAQRTPEEELSRSS